MTIRPRRSARLICALVLPLFWALLAAQAHAQSSNIKPPLRGLISMGAYKFVAKGTTPVNTMAPLNAVGGIFGGIVVIASWAQLQPTSSTSFDPSAIDQFLTQVRAYNKQYPARPLAVKLRVWGGFMAPDWAKNIGGAPIAIVHNGNPHTIGRFWLPAYRNAFTNLQTLLAAKYDNVALIREVAVTQCMSVTAEPFFVPDDALAALQAAGLNNANFRFCLSNAIASYAAWKRTRLDFSVNVYGLGPGPGDPAFTRKLMVACRASVKLQCVLDNHDLDSTPPGGIGPIQQYMKTLGPEIEFQTFKETPANFEATIRHGVTLGASSIELWQDFPGFPKVAVPTLRHWANLIAANSGNPATWWRDAIDINSYLD
jgi:hypothetical protein